MFEYGMSVLKDANKALKNHLESEVVQHRTQPVATKKQHPATNARHASVVGPTGPSEHPTSNRQPTSRSLIVGALCKFSDGTSSILVHRSLATRLK